MTHSSRRERRTKAIAEVWAMIDDAHPLVAPHQPRPVLETEELALRKRHRILRRAGPLCRARGANEPSRITEPPRRLALGHSGRPRDLVPPQVSGTCPWSGSRLPDQGLFTLHFRIRPRVQDLTNVRSERAQRPVPRACRGQPAPDLIASVNGTCTTDTDYALPYSLELPLAARREGDRWRWHVGSLGLALPASRLAPGLVPNRQMGLSARRAVSSLRMAINLATAREKS